MKMYVARDEDGRIFLFNEEPYQKDWREHGKVWDSDEGYMKIDDNAFPEVTFENSPIEVELKLIEK